MRVSIWVSKGKSCPICLAVYYIISCFIPKIWLQYLPRSMSKNSAYSCLAWLATITLISVTVYLGCLPSTSQNKWQFMAQHLCQPFCSSSLMLTFPHLQIYLCSERTSPERTSPEQRQIHEPHLDGMGYDKLKLLDAHPCDGCNHWLAQLSDRLFLLVTSVTPRWSLTNKIARARLLFFLCPILEWHASDF